MLTKKMPQLIRYFYPCQVVNADPTHVASDTSSPIVNIDISHESTKDNPNQFALDITLSLNKEKSENSAYDFKLQIFGLFLISDDERSNFKNCTLIGAELLIGCLRERLSILTQSGPWPQIMLSIQSIDHLFNNNEA